MTRIERGVAVTIGTRIVQISCGLAGTIVTARFLGPTARGDYFFVVTTALVVVQFANLGLQSTNTYRVAREPHLFGALVANSLWTSILLGLGGALLAVLVLRETALFPTTSPSLLWFVVPLVPAMLIFLLGTNLLVGTHRLLTFNAFETFGNLAAVGALIVAGTLSATAGALLGATSAAWLVTGVLLAVFLIKVSDARLEPRLDVLSSGLRYAFKAYLIAVCGYLVLRGNVFLLQHFYGARELGYYSIAAQAGDALAILPTSVALVLFPRLVRDARGRWSAAVRSVAVVAAILAVVCGITAALATPFVRIAFGARYAPAADVLRIMLPGVFAIGTATILSQYLAAVGMPRAMVAVWGGAVVVVLALGRCLIPLHAGAGAAAALSTTYGVVLVFLAALAWRYREATPSDQTTPVPPDVADAPST
jgi:antigen flippase